MIDFNALAPAPPDWCCDWDAILRAFPALSSLRGCPQDPRYHAEGDAWAHTRLACAALGELPAFRALDATARAAVFAATLLHDIGKPAATRRDASGGIVAPFHGPRGAVQARALLWRLGVPFRLREQICALIRFHQVPFHLLETMDSARRAIEVSQTARCDWLALLACADASGRSCDDGPALLERVALFEDYCEELGCRTRPFAFASEHSRFLYFRTEAREPRYAAHDTTRCEVVLMAGLPGAGKDHWLGQQAAERPVIALDGIRTELQVGPHEPQGAVAAEARARARELLRSGRSFAFNGTHLSRPLRRRIIDLLAAYDARVRIVYVEAGPQRLFAQNARRRAPVPAAVIERLLTRWDVPDLTEAHSVEYVIHD